MKKRFVLMAALVASLSVFASCDDDDDNDNTSATIPTAKYAGKATMAVSVMGQKFDFATVDTLCIAPDSKGEFANISFAGRNVSVEQMGGMTITIGSFVVDSVVVTSVNGGLKLSREGKFNTETSFAMGMAPVSSKSVSGSLSDGSTIKDGDVNVTITDIVVGEMPGSLSLVFEGEEIK